MSLPAASPKARPLPHRPVAVFAMPEAGHFQRLLPLVAGLAGAGAPVHVFTHARFREAVLRSGGAFRDLFGSRPVESADSSSLPVPCRFVAYAGVHGEAVAREVAALRPGLVVYDTFAVIGRVVADLLGLPAVNVCAGHNVAPGPYLASLRADPRVRIAPECLAAVERLRERPGWSDASPFSYVTALSRDLNLYCEPEAFLEAGERRVFEPVEFFGSLDGEEGHREEGDREPREILVSFGTIVWRYYAAEALAALRAVADAVAARPGARARIGLGGAQVDGRSLERPNVRVESYLDQRALLRRASVFVTHQGLNSTHEAIWSRVPMLSYPFFWDQPALAEKCRRLGIALPLADRPRAPLTPREVTEALDAVERSRPAMEEALGRARALERETIARRPAVVRRVLALAGSRS